MQREAEETKGKREENKEANRRKRGVKTKRTSGKDQKDNTPFVKNHHLAR